MTSIELKDRLAKAEEKVTKCENTIERHMKQLEKRQAKLLRVEWMAQYMEDLTVVMWDEEKRSEYKRATGDDLYWDCCDVQSKEEDIKGAKRKLEDQKEVVSNWREKLAKQVEKELTLANEVPEAFREAKEALVASWVDSDIRAREAMLKSAKFGTDRIARVVTGYALYEEGKGYIAFSSDRDEFGILVPYIPCGGKRALQSILDAGGFCSFDGMEYVQELGA